jgi:hypothetical protein
MNLLPVESSVKRVKELVALLYSHKLKAFRLPECLGCIDYREEVESGGSHHQAVFGLAFEFLEDAVSDALPTSLLDLIQTTRNDRPSSSQRAKPAHSISESVLYLHAAQWLHKGIRSDGIVFSPDVNTKKIELVEPRMAGFEFLRPAVTYSNSTHLPPDPHSDDYVHPLYQGKHSARVPYSKSFGICSLGTVLLEIAYWTPIHALLEAGFPKEQGKCRCQRT